MTAERADEIVVGAIAARLRRRLHAVPDAQLAEIDAEALVDAMMAAIPQADLPHPFEALGPFYDAPGLATWLGISRQAVHQRTVKHDLLALRTGDGKNVYPAWQFTPTGAVLAGLADVVRALLDGTDEWTAAIWLTTASPVFGGRSAVDLLREGRRLLRTSAGSTVSDPAAVVLAEARADAARWRQ
ncbi:antitoxin Xre/MbcA/ParS toxin-binding domain-containing protein [Nocardioides sp.]|uniref:antitoxin Xre/MbcA/ParS toxin-binding domain-containing protein n=1 Tax=Nocardioides sp. TaxID=35761 RepID=UPI00261067E8|nr:antitoxin Xre/MbcA/ParS toxin-binding domain-containing protein [Nocardioides sp.]